MNLYLRLFWAILRALAEARISTRVGCRHRFRVWPTDIDAFGHMNNGRYLQIMDVARARWLWRTGVIPAMWRNGWKVALGGNLTRFRHPLKLMDRYDVTTRLVCWDRRWFYLEHVFYNTNGRFIAIGISRAAFRFAGRWLETRDVMAVVDKDAPSPPMPAYLKNWLEVEDAMSATALPDSRESR
jgi:acyl-CoA thioesterase FadM